MTATVTGLGSTDTAGITPGYERPGCTRTTAVLDPDPMSFRTHYLWPRDAEATLCGIPKGDTRPNRRYAGGATWTGDIASCFGCEQRAKVLKVGP